MRILSEVLHAAGSIYLRSHTSSLKNPMQYEPSRLRCVDKVILDLDQEKAMNCTPFETQSGLDTRDLGIVHGTVQIHCGSCCQPDSERPTLKARCSPVFRSSLTFNSQEMLV
jgi:hypothetical protein